MAQRTTFTQRLGLARVRLNTGLDADRTQAEEAQRLRALIGLMALAERTA